MESKVKFTTARFSLVFLCFAVVVAFSACGMLNRHSVKVYSQNISHAPFDVVIVPGLPYDTGNINPLLKGRVLWAKELYDKGIARNIIFSGSAVHSPYVEGMIMKMLADSLGIPARHTFIEDKALHTNENITYGIELAQTMGFTNIAVATDAIQALLVKKHTMKDNIHVYLLPFSMKSMPVYYKTPMPRISVENAYVENFVPLKEREARVVEVVD